MKKLFMILVCLVATINVYSQNWSMEAKQNAVKAIRCKLKAPSTFVLTDYYGNKIPISKVNVEYLKGYVVYDSIMYGKDGSIVDSIEYIYDKQSNKLTDSLVYTSYKTIGIDSIEYYKWVYPPCYKCSFYYEAQNSFGGMMQGYAVVYITENEHISKFCEYNTRASTMVKIGKKDVFRAIHTPPIKIIKSYGYRSKKVKLSSGKTYDFGAMMDYIKSLELTIEN